MSSEEASAANPTPHELDQAFLKDLTAVLNAHGKDTETNCPDYILANHIHGYLRDFGYAVEALGRHEGWRRDE